MIWKVPRIWEGGDVWILGGGPSVTEQFNIPEVVVRAVKNESAPPEVYSSYMQFLHDKHVIGINVAFLIGNWIDMCFFGDAKFFTRYKEPLSQWSGLRVSCWKGVENVDWIKYLDRDPQRKLGISSSAKYVAWNSNSGAAAISVAANAGAKRIFLLGFDMKLRNGDQHWHKLYRKPAGEAPARNKKGIPNVRHSPFDKHLRCFPHIAQQAKIRGIEIINVCPDSAITAFPKMSLAEVQALKLKFPVTEVVA
jgi:hypothetical protein